MDLKIIEDWIRSSQKTGVTLVERLDCSGVHIKDETQTKFVESVKDVDLHHINMKNQHIYFKTLTVETIGDSLDIGLLRQSRERSGWFNKLYELYSNNENMTLSTTFEAISTHCPISVSRKRIENRFLNCLKYYKDLGVYLRNDCKKNSCDVLIGADESLVTVANRILPLLARGQLVTVTVDTSNAATILLIAHFVDLCYKSNFPISAITLKYLKFEKPNFEKQHPLSVIVLCENSDYHSATERLVELLIHRNSQFNRFLVFVQQSISQIFQQRFKLMAEKLLVSGNDLFNGNFNILDGYELNFDALCIFAAIEDHNNSSKLNAHFFNYRSNEELLKLLTCIPFIHCLNIWTEDISLGLELANLIKDSPVVWINSVLNYHPSVPLDDYFWLNSSKALKPLNIDNYSTETIKVFNGSVKAYEKWSTVALEDRMKVICKLFGNSFEYLNTMIAKMRTVQEISKYMVISKRKPVGIKLIQQLPKSCDLLNLIGLCLLSGNSIVLSTELAKDNKDLIDLMKKIDENLIQLTDTSQLLHKQHNNSIILNEKQVGMVFEETDEDIQSLLESLTRSQTIWFPCKGIVNYAF